ncbi:MAG: phospho-sugar mutase, partial [Oscillospiraceae bacterium]
YKVYGADGCQMTSEAADAVYRLIEQTDLFEDVLTVDFEESVELEQISMVSERVIADYEQAVLACRQRPGLLAESDLSVVYTPLNGSGNLPVRRVLAAAGLRRLTVVPEQELPDGNFPTCGYPNPELPEAMALGVALTERLGADLLIGTDPDSDRVGVGVAKNGRVTLLSGNEVGVLLTDYIGSARTERHTMPERPILVKSIVSTPLADLVAAHYGIETVNVLTGFKYIGETILHLEQQGEQERFVFGFEESCGYLPAGYVRDKDGVNAVMLICEMAAYYKEQGETLQSRIQALYETYGFYQNDLME